MEQELPETLEAVLVEGLEGATAEQGLRHSDEIGGTLAEMLCDSVEGAAELVGTGIEHLRAFTEILPEGLQPLAEGMISALEVLRDGLATGAEWVRENQELVAAACEILVVAEIAFRNPAELVEHLLNSPEAQEAIGQLVTAVIG